MLYDYFYIFPFTDEHTNYLYSIIFITINFQLINLINFNLDTIINIFFLFIFIFIIPLIIFILNIILSKKTSKNREKNSSFECGFDPISNTRIPFRIQFFLISLMFLIFDIEITLLIPLIYSILFFNISIIFSFIIFILILIIRIYIEYSENIIEWKI